MNTIGNYVQNQFSFGPVSDIASCIGVISEDGLHPRKFLTEKER